MMEMERAPQRTSSKSVEDFSPVKAIQSANTSGSSVMLSGVTANRIRSHFGIEPNQLNIRESSAVSAVGANALTQGGSIAFAPGAFNTERLGHELSHVRESALGGVTENIAGTGVNYDAARESAAASAGSAFASGSMGSAQPVSLSGVSSSAPVMGDWNDRLRGMFSSKNKSASDSSASGSDSVGPLNLSFQSTDSGSAPGLTPEMINALLQSMNQLPGPPSELHPSELLDQLPGPPSEPHPSELMHRPPDLTSGLLPDAMLQYAPVSAKMGKRARLKARLKRMFSRKKRGPAEADMRSAGGKSVALVNPGLGSVQAGNADAQAGAGGSFGASQSSAAAGNLYDLLRLEDDSFM